jgi:phospholipid/cholesterol/gamma-HCH transport system substrate-binding protein
MHTKPALHLRVVLGLAGALFLISSGVILVDYGLGRYDGGYQLVAVFSKSAQGLDSSSDVKMRGVTIGGVKGISLQRDGKAKVTLKMRHGAHVPDTVAATIEPLSVFGAQYVSLDPGDHELSGPYLSGGSRITRTSISVAFTSVLSKADSVLSAVNAQDLMTIFQTFADSVGGLGPQLGHIIDNSSTLVDIAARHIPQTEQFLNDLAKLSNSLVNQIPSISATVNNLNQLLPVVSSRTDQLGAVLDQASSIAGQLSGYINGHRDSFAAFVDSAAAVLRVAYLQVPHFPDVFNLLNQFFGRVGDAVRLPGPGGVLIGALHGGVLADICANILVPGVCKVPAK